ncbi:MAG: hypothetical protein JWM44_1181 [Bacilli bacterium]|nr:hypothetical protein [Bacilli bacterium]
MKLINKLMPTGRRSLLFGVHQFIWHPWTVYRAWVYLYGRPTFKEISCIIIHDWGYWFCPNMDDEQGQKHPQTGAQIAMKLFGEKYFWLVLLHSRHYAKQFDYEPSKLCWADKLSILYDPKQFYLFRARLSGEIEEYRKNAEQWIPLIVSDRIWFDWIREKFIKLAKEKKADAVPYMNKKAQ